MKWRNLAIVVAIFAALGAWVYFYEIKGDKAREEAKEKQKKLFTFESKDVSRIDIQAPNGEVSLQRDKENWRLIKPLESKADQSTADNLASDFSSAQIERTIAEPNILWKTYGLDPAQVKLSCKLSNGSVHQLELGEKDFTENSVFARIPGQNKVLVINSPLLNSATKKLLDFRDKTLVEFKRDEVRDFSIAIKGKPAYRFEKSGDNWEIREPLQVRADRSEVDSILSELENGKVEDFVDNPDKNLISYGMDKPEIRLDLFVGGNRTRKSLLIGKKVDQFYYAKDEARDNVFKAKEDLYKKLNFDPQKLRDKKLVRFERADVTNFEVKSKDKDFVFFKGSNGKWKLSRPEGHKGKYVTEYRLFWPLEDLEGKEIIDNANLKDPQYGFGEPSVQVRIIDKNKKTVEILLGKMEKDLVYARRMDQSTVYRVDKKVLDDLNFKLEDILEK
jgi:hypothetical protein